MKSATSDPGQFSLPNLNMPATESLICPTAKSSPKPMAVLSVILAFNTPSKGSISVLARGRDYTEKSKGKCRRKQKELLNLTTLV